jgi:ABC-type branched-subunit amino acid transport system substrate-binding protein
MLRFALAVSLCAAAALAVAGCPPRGGRAAIPGPYSDDPDAERAFKAAVDLFEAGSVAAADSAFAAFANDFPKDPLYGGAIVYRARIAIAQDAPRTALALCASLAGAKVDKVTLERARLYEGIAAAAAGEHARAVELLKPFLGALADPEENELLLASLWRAAIALGDLGRALGWLDGYLAIATAEGDVAEARRALDELLAGIIDPEALSEAAAAVDARGVIWPRVIGRLVRVRFDRGDLDGAEAALAELAAAGRTGEADVADVALLVEKRTRVDLASIGCVLPLSGRARAVGEATLRGVMLGAKKLRLPDGRPFSIVVRDSEGSAARAVAAAEELVVGNGVAALIGPLDGAEAEAVAQRAAELGAPALLLAPVDDLAARGALRVLPSPRAEIEALVAAAEEKGATRHAILYPDNAAGAALRDLYVAALARSGRTPLAQISYPDGTTDFTPFAKKLAGRGADVVFVPDASSRLALAAPALAAAGVLAAAAQGAPAAAKPGAILAAPSAGLSPDLARRAGRYLQGALLAAHFFEKSAPSAAQFAEQYRAEFSGEPSHYAAYGHDAALLLEAPIAGGATTRAAIGSWLRAQRPGQLAALPTATRFAGFDAGGAPSAAPFVLTLAGDAWEIAR